MMLIYPNKTKLIKTQSKQNTQTEGTQNNTHTTNTDKHTTQTNTNTHIYTQTHPRTQTHTHKSKHNKSKQTIYNDTQRNDNPHTTTQASNT